MDSYCLICGNSLRKASSLIHMFYIDDCICKNCLDKLQRKRKMIKIGDLKIEGLYVYEGLMQEMILQYKEMYDEALAYMFVYRDIAYLKKKYHDYILVPIPSSKADMERRGFKHVNKMFEILGLPIEELFIKKDDMNLKNANYAQRLEIKDHISKIKDINHKSKILLIDDVLTSGASMNACFNLLKDYENVSGLVISYNEIYLQKYRMIYNKLKKRKG